MNSGSPKNQSKLRSYWPLLGLLLAGTVGVLAWFLSPAIDTALRHTLPNFNAMPPDQLRIFTTVVLFVVFLLLASLIVAASAPKKKSMVSEKNLLKEREDLIKEKKLTRARRQQMNKMNKG